jgi:hypothetical protein
LKSQNPISKVNVLFNVLSPIDFNCFSDPNSAHILEKFVVHMPF